MPLTLFLILHPSYRVDDDAVGLPDDRPPWEHFGKITEMLGKSEIY